MSKIKIAVVGIGNCASSLIQGIEYYSHKEDDEHIGLMHYDLGGYKPQDIGVVAAFDIDKRKVGKDLAEAIFAPPNCATIFCNGVTPNGVKVRMGRIMDGFSEHMKDYDGKHTFVPSNEPEPSKEDMVGVLKECGAEILLNYLPWVPKRPRGFTQTVPWKRASASSTTFRFSLPATRLGRPALRRGICRLSGMTSNHSLVPPLYIGS